MTQRVFSSDLKNFALEHSIPQPGAVTRNGAPLAKKSASFSRALKSQEQFVCNHQIEIFSTSSRFTTVPSGSCARREQISPDDLLAHVAPHGWEHIGLTGDYVWAEANPAAQFRPLREVRSSARPPSVVWRYEVLERVQRRRSAPVIKGPTNNVAGAAPPAQIISVTMLH
jgi:hypothetical protein